MSTTVPTAYSTLTTLFSAAVSSATVYQGEVGTYRAPKQIVLGDVVGSEQPITVGSPTQFAESYDITVEAHSYIGGDDIAGRRADAIAMWSACRDAINSDPTVGMGTACHAWVSNYTVAAGFDTKGVSAQAQFTVHFDNVTT